MNMEGGEGMEVEWWEMSGVDEWSGIEWNGIEWNGIIE